MIRTIKEFLKDKKIQNTLLAVLVLLILLEAGILILIKKDSLFNQSGQVAQMTQSDADYQLTPEDLEEDDDPLDAEDLEEELN